MTVLTVSEVYARVMMNDVQKGIIESLKGGEKTTSKLAEELSKISPGGISPLVVYLHAWYLEQKGLVESKGEGIERTYKLTDKWRELESKAQRK